MGHKFAIGGAWSNAASWDSTTNTLSYHASTNITVTSGGVYSATFTAPNTTNASTGFAVLMTGVGSAGNLVATLQEASGGGGAWVDVAGATATVTITGAATNAYCYFRFTTPYVFAATTAGYYRMKLNTSGAAGTTSVAADSGGANFAFSASDNRTGVPAATDNIFCFGFNITTPTTLTVDGTQQCGDGVTTAVIAAGIVRTVGLGMMIDCGGVVQWDTAASATLTSKGHVIVGRQGELDLGTVASPYPTGKLANLRFNENGVSCSCGLGCQNGGKIKHQGLPLAFHKTTYASGVGTAADPLIVADAVNWAVNDEIIIAATSNNAANYNESENKFIKTVNSPTSYVISDTAGGGESALSYVHTTSARIFNVTRNVLIDSTTTTESWYFYNMSQTTGNVDLDWARYETLGTTASYKQGIQFGVLASQTADGDYCVAYRPLYIGFNWQTSKVTKSHTGLIVCNQNATSAAGIYVAGSANNKSFSDCWTIKCNRGGIMANNASALTLTGCGAISCNTAGDAYGAFYLLGQAITLTNCEAHANRTYGLQFAGSQVTLNSFLGGSKGENKTADILVTTDTYNDVVFNTPTMSSSTPISNYLNGISGSKIAFQTYNGTANDHRLYTNTGLIRTTGAGLADTNVRTAGHLGLRLSPEDATDGTIYQFQILAKASSSVHVDGFLQKNAAFGADSLVAELWLPGATSASATQTLANDTAWNVFSLTANYTGSVPLLATVKIIAKTVTASAYAYLCDLFNGSNDLTALLVYYNGQPASIIYPELGDPEAVWGVNVAGNIVAGSFGELAYKIGKRVANIIGLIFTR